VKQEQQTVKQESPAEVVHNALGGHTAFWNFETRKAELHVGGNKYMSSTLAPKTKNDPGSYESKLVVVCVHVSPFELQKCVRKIRLHEAS
jgi:hypothetical protein